MNANQELASSLKASLRWGETIVLLEWGSLLSCKSKQVSVSLICSHGHTVLLPLKAFLDLPANSLETLQARLVAANAISQGFVVIMWRRRVFFL